jgi:hypothetical protein
MILNNKPTLKPYTFAIRTSLHRKEPKIAKEYVLLTLVEEKVQPHNSKSYHIAA